MTSHISPFLPQPQLYTKKQTLALNRQLLMKAKERHNFPMTPPDIIKNKTKFAIISGCSKAYLLENIQTFVRIDIQSTIAPH